MQRGSGGDSADGRAPSTISICLLGGFRVRSEDRDLSLPESTWRLVAFLALAGRPVSRRFAAHSLWLDKPECRAEANLRSSIWRLRQTGWSIVRSEGHQIALADGVEVDVHTAAEIAGTLWHRASDVEETIDLDRLLNVDLLPDWYDDFVEVERERFRQLVLHAHEAVASELGRRGDMGRALDVALRAVAAAPWRESAHRVVIRLHLAEGNVAEAVRQFRRLERTLDSELGVRPSELTESVIASALSRR